MSFLQYQDSNGAAALQIWNNAAFDNEDSGDFPLPVKNSLSHLQTAFENQSASVLEPDSVKENLIPLMVNSLVSVKSSVPSEPLHPNGVIGNSQRSKPLKLFFKDVRSVEPTSAVSNKGREENDEKVRDDKTIDAEIEQIEKEIKMLSSRLEALKLEKAERNLKTTEKRGRIVPAKFMAPKQSVKNSDGVEKRSWEEPFSAKVKEKGNNRRGMSLGPAEIAAGVRSRFSGKLEITPVQSIQNRRKSCFWKLPDIDEVKAVTERGQSLSLSPNTRKTAGRGQVQKKAATTMVSKRPVKKVDGVLSLIEPKKLFKDVEKSVPSIKKPFRAGRVVASRYNQMSTQPNRTSTSGDVRKRSLPENDKDEGKRYDKRRASSVGKSRGNQETEGRVKKKWEIPSEIVFYRGDEEKKSVSFVVKMAERLPKIRAMRCAVESPRDSGPAKRVAELAGKRSYFCADEDGETSVCQTLSFAEEGDDEQ